MTLAALLRVLEPYENIRIFDEQIIDSPTPFEDEICIGKGKVRYIRNIIKTNEYDVISMRPLSTKEGWLALDIFVLRTTAQERRLRSERLFSQLKHKLEKETEE